MNNNLRNWAQQDDVIEQYAQDIMDGMDMKTMECFVFDTLVQNLKEYTGEELITEIVESYGEEWFTERNLVVPLEEVA